MRHLRAGDPDRVRPAAAQAEHRAPVVQALPVAARDHRHAERRRGVGTGGREHHGGQEVGAVGGAGAEVPLPLDDPAVGGRRRGAHRDEARRGAEVPAGAEDIALHVLGEQRAGLQRVSGGKAQAPTGRRAASRDLHDRLVEGADGELVATEPARLQHAVEAGVVECTVQLLGVERALLGGGLLVAQLRAQRPSAVDDGGGGQPRLGHGDVLRSDGAHVARLLARSANQSSARGWRASRGSPPARARAPIRMRLTGTSSTLPDSVRGTSAIGDDARRERGAASSPRGCAPDRRDERVVEHDAVAKHDEEHHASPPRPVAAACRRRARRRTSSTASTAR